MTDGIKVPDADHPITIDTDSVRLIARVGDTVIADTDAALTLRPSASHSYCPYKGDASYYSLADHSRADHPRADHSLADGDARSENAVWTYVAPYDAVSPIAGHVAFYPDRVTISAA
jgi:uncharacterized protein (DUF427 family)